MPKLSVNSMLKMISSEADPEKALDQLNVAVMEATHSRNSMIALMNDELGCLELAHGAGEEWSRRIADQRFRIDVNQAEGIVSYVAATGSGFMSGDVQNEPRYKNLFGTTLSEIAMPVRDRNGRIRAVLNLESDKADAYDDSTYEFCEAVAELISLVLARAEQSDDSEALVQVGNALDTALTEDELLKRVLKVAGDVLRFGAFSIFLWDPDQELFMLRGSVGRLSDRVGQLGYKAGEGCTGWVCEFAEPIRLESNPQDDPRWRARYVEFPGTDVASFICVPIVSRGRCVGALRAVRRVTENTYLDNRFTESDQTVLMAIAEQFATGLDNIRSVQKLLRSERMIAWGELSAKSSHMIGNRVFALKGDVNELSHVLASPTPDLDELRSLQKSLATNVRRVEEILQDFRDFVTATQLDRVPGDLNQLVTETVHEVFPRRTPVELVLEIADHLPVVLMDAKKLRRAISELIENSFNYIECGKLRVATSTASHSDVVAAKAATGNSYVKIEVEDSGPGIDVASKRLIFQPFFSGRVKGMGLGLSIVKGIVDAHDGYIFESGEQGFGAKFVILLPLPERLKVEGI